MTDQEPVLAARGVTKRFGGVTALEAADFAVRPGEVSCLAGENGSGKSTLIKIFGGVEAPDDGAISVAGREYASLTPRRAHDHGIEIIFQDFALFGNLSVAENIALPRRLAERRRSVSRAGLRRVAGEVVDRVGVGVDLDARVEDLTVADRQLTAVYRALAQDARVIFMDEPTTALTWREVDALFDVVEQLRASGIATVFVSHKLEEVMRISERITVLRNGRVVANGPAGEFDRSRLTRDMTGRDVSEQRAVAPLDDGRTSDVLTVEALGRKGAFEDVNFGLRAGEVLGITGLLGSGRGEIAEALFGVAPADRGRVWVRGEPVRIRTVPDAIRAGIGYVPGDRLGQGLFLDQSVLHNVIAGDIHTFTAPGGLLASARARRAAHQSLQELRVRASSIDAPARNLSGGNQQRVVLAKWLQSQPAVLMLNGPTVGVDVGSKHDILQILRDKSAAGVGLIVISDDVAELTAVCHRVLVVRRGRVARELRSAEINEDTIMSELAA